MTWKHVSDALPGWLRAEIEMMKSGATEAAPSYREVEYLHTHRVNMRRSMATARPTSETPRSAVVIDLCMWKSSRGTHGGGNHAAPAYQRDREGTVSG